MVVAREGPEGVTVVASVSGGHKNNKESEMTLPRKPITLPLRGLSPVLAAAQPAAQLAETLAPVYRASKALAPAAQLAEALAPVYRASKALAPAAQLAETLAPVHRASKALAPAAQLAETLAPVYRASKALAPAAQLAEALAPVYRAPKALTPAAQLAEALAPVNRASKALAPLNVRPRLGPRVPSLFDAMPCDRPQAETRLVRVRGTREDWANFDGGHTLPLTKC